MFEAPRQIRSAAVATGNLPVGFAPLSQIDFSKIAAALWRGRATILYTTIAALALAILYVVLSPHEYTATTQILIDPTDLRAVGTNATEVSQMSDAALMQVESQVQRADLGHRAAPRRHRRRARARSGIRPRPVAAQRADRQERHSRSATRSPRSTSSSAASW